MLMNTVEVNQNKQGKTTNKRRSDTKRED